MGLTLLRSVISNLFASSLLMMKRHTVAGLSLVSRGKKRRKDSGIGLWVVDTIAFLHGSCITRMSYFSMFGSPCRVPILLLLQSLLHAQPSPFPLIVPYSY